MPSALDAIRDAMRGELDYGEPLLAIDVRTALWLLEHAAHELRFFVSQGNLLIHGASLSQRRCSQTPSLPPACTPLTRSSMLAENGIFIVMAHVEASTAAHPQAEQKSQVQKHHSLAATLSSTRALEWVSITHPVEEVLSCSASSSSFTDLSSYDDDEDVDENEDPDVDEAHAIDSWVRLE